MEGSFDVSVSRSSSSEGLKNIAQENGIITLSNGKQYKVVLGDKVLSLDEQKSLADLTVKLLNQLGGEATFKDLSGTKITHEGVFTKGSADIEAKPLKPQSDETIKEIDTLVKKIMLSTSFLEGATKRGDTDAMSFLSIEPDSMARHDLTVKIPSKDMGKTAKKAESKALGKLSEIGKFFRQFLARIGGNLAQGMQKIKDAVRRKISGSEISLPVESTPEKILKEMTIDSLSKLFENPGNKKLQLKDGALDWTARTTGLQKAKGKTGTSEESRQIIGTVLLKIEGSIQKQLDPYASLEKGDKRVPHEAELKEIQVLQDLIVRLDKQPWIQDALENNPSFKTQFNEIKESLSMPGEGGVTSLSFILERMDLPSTGSIQEQAKIKQVIGEIEKKGGEIGRSQVESAVNKAGFERIADLVEKINGNYLLKLGINPEGGLIDVARERGFFNFRVGKGEVTKQIVEAFQGKIENLLNRDINKYSSEEMEVYLKDLAALSKVFNQMQPVDKKGSQSSWARLVLQPQLGHLKDGLGESLQFKIQERMNALGNLARKEEDLTAALKVLNKLEDCQNLLKSQDWWETKEESQTVSLQVWGGFKEKVSGKIVDIQANLSKLSEKDLTDLTPEAIQKHIQSLDENLRALQQIDNSSLLGTIGIEKPVKPDDGTKSKIDASLKQAIESVVEATRKSLKALGTGFDLDAKLKGAQASDVKEALKAFNEQKSFIKSLSPEKSPSLKAAGDEFKIEGLKQIQEQISGFDKSQSRKQLLRLVLDPASAQSNEAEIKDVGRNYLIAYRNMQTTEQLFEDLESVMKEISSDGGKRVVLQMCKDWLQQSFLNGAEQAKVQDKIENILEQVENSSALAELKEEVSNLNKLQEVSSKSETEVVEKKQFSALFEEGLKAESGSREKIIGQMADGLYKMNAELFSKINMGEVFKDQKSLKNEDKEKGLKFSGSQLFDQLIASSNSMTNFCVKMIIEGASKNKGTEIDTAVKTMDFLISLADACLQKGDFQSVMTLAAVLSHNSVSRLTAVEKKLSQEQVEKMNKIMDIADPRGNNANVAKAMNARSTEPLVPFWPRIRGQLVGALTQFSDSANGLYGVGATLSPIPAYQEKLKGVDLKGGTIDFPKDITIDEKEIRNQSLLIQPRKEEQK